ncbi:MAG TPA: patatin-like phospholipase family protein [Myxococcales bacterium]|jgi:NTE family protein|nr:patatin-like phospholipase family protein [Myxococcales bacterium]
MKDLALVLGGGGPVGVAWEAGLLAGLFDEGVDVRRAEFVLGTSAGSIVGSAVAMGVDLHLMAELQRTIAQGAGGPPPDISKLIGFLMRLPPINEPGLELRQEIGRYALEAKPEGEEKYIDRLGANLAPGEWPERFACTAVDATSGEFRLWRKADGVELKRAVAASCAVPGIYPSVTIGGRRWMDGGMRSSLNVDQAAGHQRVLAVAVIPAMARARFMPRFEAEAAPVRAAGGEMMLVAPDDASAEAFGPNLMDASRRPAAMEAGRAQGRKEAAKLKAFV